MEHLRHLTHKDIEISKSLGGADEPLYEQEILEPSNNDHYSHQTGHAKRHEANRELHKKLLTVGVLAVGMMVAGCMPPVDTSYYDPFADTIHYSGTPEPSTVEHEEGHKERANVYPQGRYVWGWRYATDKPFACAEEVAVGADMSHPSCQNLPK